MKRILYIEDDLEIGHIVKEDLEQRGYKVRWLTSGEGVDEELGETEYCNFRCHASWLRWIYSRSTDKT